MTNGVDFSLLNNFAEPYESDRMRLWRNDGGTFSETALALGLTDTGPGKGILSFDYDQDGDLDLFVVNTGGNPVLYRNDMGSNQRWLRVRTVGRWSNRDGIGCRLSLQAIQGGPIQMREVSAGSHFLGQSEFTAHFGLGDQGPPPARRLTIGWPSGVVQVMENLEIDRTLVVVEPLTFEAWQAREFDSDDLSDPEISGRAADPDGDRVPNELEYAFGRKPNAIESEPLIAYQIARNVEEQQNYLTIHFTRIVPPSDLDYVVEVSDDLFDWVSGPAYSEEVEVIPSGDRVTEKVVVRILPAVQNKFSTFVRIKMTLTD